MARLLPVRRAGGRMGFGLTPKTRDLPCGESHLELEDPPCLDRWLEKRERAMKIRHHFNTLPLLAVLGAATAADAQVQPQLAKQYFEEATKLCQRDAGRLWGVSLCGPLVIFDQ